MHILHFIATRVIIRTDFITTLISHSVDPLEIANDIDLHVYAIRANKVDLIKYLHHTMNINFNKLVLNLAKELHHSDIFNIIQHSILD